MDNTEEAKYDSKYSGIQLPTMGSRKRPSFDGESWKTEENQTAILSSLGSNQQNERSNSNLPPESLRHNSKREVKPSSSNDDEYPFEGAIMMISAMDSNLRIARERNNQYRLRINDLESQLRTTQESWLHEQQEKCYFQSQGELLGQRMCDINKSVDLVVSREAEVLRKYSEVKRLEEEIQRFKENHKIHVISLQEQSERSAKTIEQLRQEKLSIQFELNNSKGKASNLKEKLDEEIAKHSIMQSQLEEQISREKSKFESILKEKEDSVSKLSMFLDKQKRIIFEMSARLELKSGEGSELLILVKEAVDKKIEQLKNIETENREAKEKLKEYKSELEEYKENRNTFSSNLKNEFPDFENAADVLNYLRETRTKYSNEMEQIKQVARVDSQ